MGNGFIDEIEDIIFVTPEKFNNLKTIEMTHEIERLNRIMISEKRKYILIGPGRWGTRDKHIGIPVAWPQISNAKVIVETSLKDFPLDASLGSHFFHNVTSMNVGYLSIQHNSKDEFIQWELLKNEKIIHETIFFTHIRLEKPVCVVMDGKKRTSLIAKNK